MHNLVDVYSTQISFNIERVNVKYLLIILFIFLIVTLDRDDPLTILQYEKIDLLLPLALLHLKKRNELYSRIASFLCYQIR